MNGPDNHQIERGIEHRKKPVAAFDLGRRALIGARGVCGGYTQRGFVCAGIDENILACRQIGRAHDGPVRMAGFVQRFENFRAYRVRRWVRRRFRCGRRSPAPNLTPAGR